MSGNMPKPIATLAKKLNVLPKKLGEKTATILTV